MHNSTTSGQYSGWAPVNGQLAKLLGSHYGNVNSSVNNTIKPLACADSKQTSDG